MGALVATGVLAPLVGMAAVVAPAAAGETPLQFAGQRLSPTQMRSAGVTQAMAALAVTPEVLEEMVAMVAMGGTRLRYTERVAHLPRTRALAASVVQEARATQPGATAVMGVTASPDYSRTRVFGAGFRSIGPPSPRHDVPCPPQGCVGDVVFLHRGRSEPVSGRSGPVGGW